MAHVTGSFDTTTLPGSVRGVPAGQMCDDCGTKPAAHRVQGETDSMGAEWADLCDDCHAIERRRRLVDSAGDCDWCPKKNITLTPTRDYDEGTHGPVYHVCRSCYHKQQQALEEELRRYDDYGM